MEAEYAGPPHLFWRPPHFAKMAGYIGAVLIYHKNFLLMDNKHRELFVTKQSKWCKFLPKMQQNKFGGGVLPGPAGGVYAPPDPVAANKPEIRNISVRHKRRTKPQP